MKKKRNNLIVLAVWVVFLALCVNATGTVSGEEPSKPFAENGYPNGTLLVSTQWLKKNINEKNLVIIDVRKEGYKSSHIPGAIHLVSDDLRFGGGMKKVADVEARLSASGIGRDMKIVLYDDSSRSWGDAGWFFWLFEYLGCNDVHILDGGWTKWTAEGKPIQAEVTQRLVANKFTAVLKNGIAAHTSYVANKLQNKDTIFMDARSTEEFNGWRLYGEPRGGHIPEAVNIDYLSFYEPDKTLMDYSKIKTFLNSRGIGTDKEVVAYCTDGARSGLVYFILRLTGYQRCAVYSEFFRDWVSDVSRPMEKLARYEKLVYPAWVKDLVDGKTPPGYSGKKHVILEVRYTGFSISQILSPKENGYIPGAITIHPCYVENENDKAKYYPKYSSPKDANLMKPEKLQNAIAKLGISKDTMVVVYGNGKIIPMIASRVAWALMYAGVEDVRILDGGFTGWASAKYPVVSEAATPVPVKSFGKNVPVHPEFYATTEYARSISKGLTKNSVLVDVRKREEYAGQLNPYPYFSKKGHIPGAVWQGDWDNMMNQKDDKFRSYPEVRQRWEKLGIASDKEPVFYCGSGWRSSMGFFYAYLMGFEKMRNYEGGFYEWSWDPGNAIGTDTQK